MFFLRVRSNLLSGLNLFSQRQLTKVEIIIYRNKKRNFNPLFYKSVIYVDKKYSRVKQIVLRSQNLRVKRTSVKTLFNAFNSYFNKRAFNRFWCVQPLFQKVRVTFLMR